VLGAPARHIRRAAPIRVALASKVLPISKVPPGGQRRLGDPGRGSATIRLGS
jgi:hypothetical protein